MRALSFFLSFLFVLPLAADENILQLLQQKEKTLQTNLDDSKKDDSVLLPTKVNNEWVVVPVKKKDIEQLLKLSVMSNKLTTDQAAASKTELADFLTSYQKQLQDRLAQIKKEIEIVKNTPQKGGTAQPEQPKDHANVVIGIENLRMQTREGGFRRWDFDWVLTETNGVGVKFNESDMVIIAPFYNGYNHIVEKSTLRLEPFGSSRSPGFMQLQDPNLPAESMHESLHLIMRGMDDKGNPVVVQHCLTQ